MIDSLATYLRFDPLLAAAIILAITLVLGRVVDLVRARVERRREEVQQNVVDFAQRFKDAESSQTPNT